MLGVFFGVSGLKLTQLHRGLNVLRIVKISTKESKSTISVAKQCFEL